MWEPINPAPPVIKNLKSVHAFFIEAAPALSSLPVNDP